MSKYTFRTIYNLMIFSFSSGLCWLLGNAWSLLMLGFVEGSDSNVGKSDEK